MLNTKVVGSIKYKKLQLPKKNLKTKKNKTQINYEQINARATSFHNTNLRQLFVTNIIHSRQGVFLKDSFYL